MSSSGLDNVDNARATRLSGFFNKVLSGQRTLSTARDGKLFIEAICVQTDPPTCAHKILSSHSGLPALQASVRFDTSVAFLNDDVVPLLRYLQTPSLKAIGSGSVLGLLLLSMVEPPFFFDALTKSFVDGLLNQGASHAFAWLLLELVSLPGKSSSPYLVLAHSPNIPNTILKSSDGEIRNLGQKIKHALPSDASEFQNDATAKPGGRHDNDHADHREISILPTTDELLSKDRPFFRTADYINNSNYVSSRHSIHIDNQFRFLREDLLADIRVELKMLKTTNTGRNKRVVVDGLSLAGVVMGIDRKRLPWALVLKCKEELPQLKSISSNKRKEYLKQNRHILRQGSIACLLIDGELAALPTIHRDEEELVKKPANVIIQLVDDPTLSRALFKMKTARDVKLVQLDTAIFAFEPFLRRLQKIHDLPLKDELLDWEIGKKIGKPSFQPVEVIRALESRSGTDLKDILRIKKSVILDERQMNSLRACLLQRVSLVQGPPGDGWISSLLSLVLMRIRDWEIFHWGPSGKSPSRFHVAEGSSHMLYESCA